ncbi:MAG: DASH family cryptochrome [Bdellovibrionaceae bacterium]|nr:DASH family cryptochrome [Pseudobdellovibrionaceae bacterium]
MLDNQALAAFCSQSSEGIIFWCPDKNFHRLSEFKNQSIRQALYSFHQKLKDHHQEIIIFDESISHIFPQLISQLKIQRLYYSEECAYDEKKDEKEVAKIATQQNIQIKSYQQTTLIAQNRLPFLLEDMPLVFTDFRKKIELSLFVEDPIPAPQIFPKKISLDRNGKFEVNPFISAINYGSSEEDSLERLRYYFWQSECVLTYKDTRNGLLDKDDSTRFSIGLNVGSLSVRTIYQELKKLENTVKSNDSTYWVFFELMWRDYFKFFSLKNGHKIFLREGLKSDSARKYKCSGQDRANFLQWCEGKTENQFINANMNELNKTGWMSNRGRQNVASYLIHQLKCPWTWGADYFQRKLIDYDPDLNWGNWLYLSGQGSDPRSRVFNIDRQSSIYDPDGLYQKKWTSSL